DPAPVVFTVRPGASAGEIGEDLQRLGLIRSAAAFRVEVELRGVGGQLRVGEYELRRTMNTREVLETLAAGRTRRSGLVTIPEGWRAEEIATYLESVGVLDAEAFMDAVADRNPVEGLRLPPGAESFEGYLFPDSYDLGRDATAESVVRLLVGQFDEKVGLVMRT